MKNSPIYKIIPPFQKKHNNATQGSRIRFFIKELPVSARIFP
jgi:hypothetical protein